MDHDYKMRLYGAIDATIVMSSVNRETNVATVKVPEAALALMEQLAFLASMAPAIASPSRTEAFCGAVARELAVMIAKARGRGPPEDLIIYVEPDPDPDLGPDATVH